MTPEAAQEWMRKAGVPGEAGWDDMWNVGIRMHDAVSAHRFIEVLLKPPIRVNATADHLRGVLQEHGVNGITEAGPDIICVRLCGDDLASAVTFAELLGAPGHRPRTGAVAATRPATSRRAHRLPRHGRRWFSSRHSR